MQTESLERALRDALRETLDRELGPDPAWTGSPAARRVADLERRRRWPLRELAVAAVLSAAGGAALLAGALNQPIRAGSMWPQSTLEEVRAAQKLADAGDPQYTWQLEDLSGHLLQGGPFREEMYRRFLEEKLGWEDFHWTLGGGRYLDQPGVYFLRCAPSPANVFLDGDCEPTIDEFRYETVHINVAQPGREGPSGIWVVTSWEIIEPYERPAPLEADVDALLNGFVAARLAGAGAEEYLDDPEADVPLLYTTTSGVRYETGGFGEMRYYQWPYGLRAFMVWLEVDGLVVVNQLFFMPPDGRRRLEYVPDGFGTDLAPTIEDTWPVAARYVAFDGEVTLHVAHPWVFRSSTTSIRLVPTSRKFEPTTDGGERNDWDRLVLMANPVRTGSGCPTGPGPADAQALAESLRSDPSLVTTAPVATSAGGADGVWMDVGLAAGANVPCGSLYGQTELQIAEFVNLAAGDRMRLWLFDAPEGSSMQILAVAMVVPESQFERATAGAASISVEFSSK